MAITTAEMLAEIESGTALQAMNSVRYHTAPPGPLFVSQLDEALAPYRSSTHGSTLQRGDFIEVVGASGSGKSTFINFLLLTSLLPYSLPLPIPSSSTPHPIPLGGKSQHCALLYASSSSSTIPALAKAMRSHIRGAVSGTISTVGPGRLTPAMERAIEDCVRESLERLRVVRVKGRYRYWALALRGLAYPPSRPGGVSSRSGSKGQESLSLVCLDGLSGCFWPERYAEEERAAAGKKRAGVPGVRGLEDIGMKDVMEAIGGLRKEMGCVVVSTTQGLWHEKKPDTSQPTIFFAPYLPPPYPSPWTIRPGVDSDPPSTSNHTQSIPLSSSSRTQVDAAHWPLTFQLALLGRARGLQFPTDMTLGDALYARDRNRGGGERYMARVRMRGVEGRLGTRMGVEWGFGVGPEGFEVFTE